MVSDGIDRLRGNQPTPSRLGPNFGRPYHSMPAMSPDVSSASEISQRYNVVVYTLYAVGIGRAARSSWNSQVGLSRLATLSNETGGDTFSGDFEPGQFQTLSGAIAEDIRQSVLCRFRGGSGKKGELRWVNFTTEVSNLRNRPPTMSGCRQRSKRLAKVPHDSCSNRFPSGEPLGVPSLVPH